MVAQLMESGEPAEDETGGESGLEESCEGSLANNVTTTGTYPGQPFPEFLPISVRCLPQTHPLRYICLRMITNPYPSHANTGKGFGKSPRVFGSLVKDLGYRSLGAF